MVRRLIAISITLVMSLTLVLSTGCVGIYRAHNVETSGFLGDYSQLHKGAPDEALLTYVNPNADFSKYNAIILDPIKVYAAQEDSSITKIKEENLQKLINYFDAAIRKNLEDNFKFVDAPGAGVMRFRIAITEAKSGSVPVDVVSSIVPYGLAANAVSSIVFDRNIGVGAISAEFEALDSQTNERLGAFVDALMGTKFTGRLNKFSKWRAARDAFDYWGERMKTRLIELQNVENTPR